MDKKAGAGNTTMLVLRLLAERDMYGYQIIEELDKRSDNTFQLKTGTLYPILHGLEKEGMVSSYEEQTEQARVRKYYHLTEKGSCLLAQKRAEWQDYLKAVNSVMEGAMLSAAIG